MQKTDELTHPILHTYTRCTCIGMLYVCMYILDSKQELTDIRDLHTGSKFPTRECDLETNVNKADFMPRYKISHPGMKLHTYSVLSTRVST
jgi:hypothetical protein